MKLVTKVLLSFAVILLTVIIQSIMTYAKVNSIGNEIEEISEYQVPLNTLVMELEKDILEEEILTYKLLYYSKDIHSQKFKKIEHDIALVEKDTDEKIEEVNNLIKEAVQHSHEADVKEQYEKIASIFDKITYQQAKFEKLFKELEHNVIKSDFSKIDENNSSIEHVMHDMESEIVSIAHLMEGLLEKSTHQALEDEHKVILSLIIVSILIFFVVLIVSYIISTQIKNAIATIQNHIKGICNTRDLKRQLNLPATDEVGHIAKDIDFLVDSMRNIIDSTKKTSCENASISHELATASTEVGNNVEKSVTIVDEITQKASGVKEEMFNAVSDAIESKKDILQANEELAEARNNIISLTSQVQDSAQIEIELSHRMTTLSSEASEVKSVLEVISDIADQTNLLALNAAIEAARAGEHGRGFAVVADEVRKLAERTQKSLTEINATINVIVQSIMDVSQQMNNNSQEIQSLADVSKTAEEKIISIVNIVTTAVSASEKTVNDFEVAGNNIEDIVNNVININTMSSSNARSVEEIAAAANHLNTMTDKLNAKLGEFNT